MVILNTLNIIKKLINCTTIKTYKTKTELEIISI